MAARKPGTFESGRKDNLDSDWVIVSSESAGIEKHNSCKNPRDQSIGATSAVKASDRISSHKLPNSFDRLKLGRTPGRSSSSCDLSQTSSSTKANVVNVANGTIQVSVGDITKATVDAIVVLSNSDSLREYVLNEAGDSIRQTYETEKKRQPDKCIYTNGGNLPCKKIYFIPCPQMSSDTSEWTFRNFIKGAMKIASNDRSATIQSLALPAIGCGLVGCDPTFAAKTLILAVAYELEHQPSLQLNVSFIIQRRQQNVLDAFRSELTALEQKRSNISKIVRVPSESSFASPATHHKSRGFIVEKRLLDQSSNDYKLVMKEFTSTMTASHYSSILRIELVWNECTYKQYKILKAQFSQRLQEEPERLLFHGCSEDAANGIINGWFNRSWAGVHGTVYGQGSYFSSRACYSHSYATPNSKGERCMFLAKVLVGNSILGNSSMKVCPPGYDTTTDGSHIYVVYHDAQAFGKYLITYK